MEVGVGQLDVAQGRYLEPADELLLAGHPTASLGRVVSLERLDQPHLLVGVAADGHPVVTGGAAFILEQLIALQLLRGQRLGIPLQPAIERRIGGDQGLLEGGDGIGHLVDAEVRLAVHGAEPGPVLGQGVQGLHRQLVGEGHLQRVLDGARRLRLQILGAPIPELHEVEAGVEHGGRVDRPLLPLVAEGTDLVVYPAGRQVVAGVAGDGVGFREPRLEEQHLAQLDFFRCAHLGRFHRLDRLVRPPHPWQAQRQQQTIFIHFFSLPCGCA